MSVAGITTNGINYIKGTELEGMSVQMMAAMVMLEVGATKKHEAKMKIGEMKSQNDRAKKLNDLVDKITRSAGACTGDGDDAKKVCLVT